MKLSNQKCCLTKISVWHIAVRSHRRINVTNAFHTKPFPKLVTLYFSSASVANDADGTSTKHVGDDESHGVRVQLNNGSLKRECLGACGASTFKVCHYSLHPERTGFQRTYACMYTRGAKFQSSPKKYSPYKFFKTFVLNEAN